MPQQRDERTAADLDRRDFLMDKDAWRAFNEALNRQAQDVAGLRELLTTPTTLDAAPTGTRR